MEYTFRFYKNDKHVTTKTFHTETIEDAYRIADCMLATHTRYDDWECIPPKTNNNPIGISEGKKGTQGSPFGL